MSFHFCPQCGTKLQPSFRFCPSCGQSLPCSSDAPGPESAAPVSVSPLRIAGIDEASLSASSTTGPFTPVSPCPSTLVSACPSTPVSIRRPLRNTRTTLFQREESIPAASTSTFICSRSPRPTTSTSTSTPICTPRLAASTSICSRSPRPAASTSICSRSPRPATSTSTCSPRPAADEHVTSTVSPLKVRAEDEQPAEPSSLPALASPPAVRAACRTPKRTRQQQDEGETPGLGGVSSPLSSVPRSPSTVTAGVKRAKRACVVAPLQEGEELTDTTGGKWSLVRLLSQSSTELIYEVSPHKAKQSEHILKLGSKDGKIFNEQNFLQRAARPSSVNKWMKGMKMDFLGIPSCVGFGLHADAYRFLIFPSMGQTLQSIMEAGAEVLSERAVLQLACGILDVLQFLHSNEYVHADIHADNIYIKADEQTQVYLAGYCHAFRFCPGGVHVEYRENSRTLHEGASEFISLDSHKGAGPSRRSDLQSLGYCMLRWHTGTLPWTTLTSNLNKVASEKQRYMEDVPALLSHCFGRKRVSSALRVYLTSVMGLQFSEQPDYTVLKAGLADSLSQLGGSLTEPLDL